MSEMTTKSGWRVLRKEGILCLFLPNGNGQFLTIKEEDFNELAVWQADNMGAYVMPKTLTAKNGAKYFFSGEFSESVTMNCLSCQGTGYIDEEEIETCGDCTGAGSYNLKVTIGWPTIKEIYAKAVEKLRIK
jgi:hypothetical protein